MRACNALRASAWHSAGSKGSALKCEPATHFVLVLGTQQARRVVLGEVAIVSKIFRSVFLLLCCGFCLLGFVGILIPHTYAIGIIQSGSPQNETKGPTPPVIGSPHIETKEP